MGHSVSRSALLEFDTIRSALTETDIWYLFHQQKDKLPGRIVERPHYAFTDQSWKELGYSRMINEVIPGNAHAPVFEFFEKTNCTADYLWLIESDVRFTGNWADFFEAFENVEADFLTCHIRRQPEAPTFIFWPLKHPTKEIALENRLLSFNPVYRISARAITFLAGQFRDGWCGHNEMILPTLLYNHGYQLRDIGGDGEFVPEGWKNRFYTSWIMKTQKYQFDGTMRYRPMYHCAGQEASKLYHPVKPLDVYLAKNYPAFKYLRQRYRGVCRRLGLRKDGMASRRTIDT